MSQSNNRMRSRTSTVIDPRGVRTVTENDEQGRPFRVTDGLGNTVELRYDAAGLKTSQILTEVAADGRKEVFTIGYGYDDQGRLTSVTDRSDINRPLTTRYEYDLRGNRTKIIEVSGAETAFEYDIKGRMTRKTDAIGAVTGYEYDEADRVVSMTDSNGNTTRFAWDAGGNLAAETRADGAVWRYQYDGRATWRLAFEKVGKAAGTMTSRTSLTFRIRGTLFLGRKSSVY